VRARLLAVALAVGAVGTLAVVLPAGTDCTPVGYDTTRDADPAYWQQWDTWMAQGYHGHPGQAVDLLWPRGC
jgi:hypothetical protein